MISFPATVNSFCVVIHACVTYYEWNIKSCTAHCELSSSSKFVHSSKNFIHYITQIMMLEWLNVLFLCQLTSCTKDVWWSSLMNIHQYTSKLIVAIWPFPLGWVRICVPYFCQENYVYWWQGFRPASCSPTLPTLYSSGSSTCCRRRELFISLLFIIVNALNNYIILWKIL
jgi:hypothetical protein